LGINERLLTDLNQSQIDAVTYLKGPQIILAGAGSGKTRVLTRKLAWLVSCGGYSPWDILAVTFTNRAAAEMRSRVEEILGMSVRGMWVCTFHSACLRILRTCHIEAGLSDNFVVYDANDSLDAVKEALKSLSSRGSDALESGVKPGDIQARISMAKSRLITPETFQQQGDELYDELTEEVFSGYEACLARNNALDFDDLICRAIRLLRSNEKILQRYRGKFKYILVDEFQDTNIAQYEFVSLLCEGHKRICVVGDDDQSIYSWRGAMPGNMMDFIGRFGSLEGSQELKVSQLLENYRSTSAILQASHDVISQNLMRTKMDPLIPMRGDGEMPLHYIAASEREEAAFVTTTIDWLIREHDYCLDDFAIFYRTHAQSRGLEESFLRRGIPYRVVRGVAFYSRAEVKDIFAYLKIFVNPEDDLALKRIINVPTRKIGKTTIGKMETAAAASGLSLYSWLLAGGHVKSLPKKAVEAVSAFLEFLQFQMERSRTLPLAEFFSDFMDDLGYARQLKNSVKPEDRQRAENLDELITIVQEYSHISASIADDSHAADSSGALSSAVDYDDSLFFRTVSEGLQGFLQYVSLVSDADFLDSEMGLEPEPGIMERGSVSMMSVHSAKGLEFKAVFMIGMEEELFPHFNCMSTAEAIDEERRLCYVAMTRARDRLFLTSTVSRRIYGKKTNPSTSRFLMEIDSEHIIQEYSRALRWMQDW
jgi:DNA helicase-2/ATP-dependent DNA helicase PcrA